MNNIKLMLFCLIAFSLIEISNADQTPYEQYNMLKKLKQDIHARESENIVLKRKVRVMESEYNNFKIEQKINAQTINRLEQENKFPNKLANSYEHSILSSTGRYSNVAETFPPDEQINILNRGEPIKDIFAYKWEISHSGTKGEMKIAKTTNTILSITLKNTNEKENYGTAHLLLRKNPLFIGNKNKICFMFKGDRNNLKSFFSIVITWIDKDKKNWVSKVSNGIYMQNEEWQTACFDLKKDFEVPDSIDKLIMVKIVINSNTMPKDHKASVQFKDWIIE